jgi:hypothetical protein
MFEIRVVGRLYDPKRDEIRGDWSRQNKEQLCDSYLSPNIVRVIKRRRIESAERVAHLEIRGEET